MPSSREGETCANAIVFVSGLAGKGTVSAAAAAAVTSLRELSTGERGIGSSNVASQTVRGLGGSGT
jgi:hypothetical protein